MQGKQYALGPVKQLIDINGNLTNFEATFRVSTKNKEPFQIVVVDQKTLDNTPRLEYKTVTDGEISGVVASNDGVLRNYLIVLRSENPCECEVALANREIPAVPPPPIERGAEKRAPPLGGAEHRQVALTTTSSWGSYVKPVVALCVFLGVGYLVYRLFLKKEGNRGSYAFTNTEKFAPAREPLGRYTEPTSGRAPLEPLRPVGRPGFTAERSAGGVNRSLLLEKLKNLNLP